MWSPESSPRKREGCVIQACAHVRHEEHAHLLYEHHPGLELHVTEQALDMCGNADMGYPVDGPRNPEWVNAGRSMSEGSSPKYMQSESHDTMSFPPLNGLNYISWQENLMCLYRTWHLCHWAFNAPTIESTGQEWAGSDHALCLMRMTVDSVFHEALWDAPNAFQGFKILCLMSQDKVKSQLVGFRMGDKETPDIYVARFAQVEKDYASMRGTMSPASQVEQMIRGLSPQYDISFLLRTVDCDVVLPEQLTSILIQEVIRQKDYDLSQIREGCVDYLEVCTPPVPVCDSVDLSWRSAKRQSSSFWQPRRRRNRRGRRQTQSPERWRAQGSTSTPESDSCVFPSEFPGWLMSSAATHHICNDLSMMMGYIADPVGHIDHGNNHWSPVLGRGQVVISTAQGPVVLEGVLYVPDHQYCTLSIGLATSELAWCVDMTSDKIIVSCAGKFMFSGLLRLNSTWAKFVTTPTPEEMIIVERLLASDYVFSARISHDLSESGDMAMPSLIAAQDALSSIHVEHEAQLTLVSNSDSSKNPASAVLPSVCSRRPSIDDLRISSLGSAFSTLHVSGDQGAPTVEVRESCVLQQLAGTMQAYRGANTSMCIKTPDESPSTQQLRCMPSVCKRTREWEPGGLRNALTCCAT